MLLNHTDSLHFDKKAWVYLYSETFQPEGVIGNEKFDGYGFNPDSQFPLTLGHKYSYISQPLVMVTSFLSLPNKLRHTPDLTIKDVLKNMIDWNPENEKISTLDMVFAVPMFLYFLIRSLIKLPINIAKLVTEFLPGLLEENCRLAANRVKNIFLGTLAAFGWGVFGMLHFMGRAITSPVKGARNKNVLLAVLSLCISGIAWGLMGMYALIPAVIPILFSDVIYTSFSLAAIFTTIFSPLKATYFPNGFFKTIANIFFPGSTPAPAPIILPLSSSAGLLNAMSPRTESPTSSTRSNTGDLTHNDNESHHEIEFVTHNDVNYDSDSDSESRLLNRRH